MHRRGNPLFSLLTIFNSQDSESNKIDGNNNIQSKGNSKVDLSQKNKYEKTNNREIVPFLFGIINEKDTEIKCLIEQKNHFQYELRSIKDKLKLLEDELTRFKQKKKKKELRRSAEGKI